MSLAPSPTAKKNGAACRVLAAGPCATIGSMVDPYTPPQRIDDDPLMPDDEMDALQPTWKIRVAWMALAASGFLTILSAGQLLMAVSFVDPILKAVPFTMIGTGAVALVTGAKLGRMRNWAAIGGVILGGLITVGMLTWVLFAGSRGMFSLLQLTVPAVSGGATAFCIMTLGPCRRAEEARQRLAETGIDARF